MPALCQARMQLFLLATFILIFPNNILALMTLPGMSFRQVELEPLPIVAALNFTSFDLWTNTGITLSIFLLPIVLIFLLYLIKHIFTLLCWHKTKVKKLGYEEI